MSRSLVLWIGLQTAIAIARARKGSAPASRPAAASFDTADGIWTVKLSPKLQGQNAKEFCLITDSGGAKVVDRLTRTVTPVKPGSGKLEFAMPPDGSIASFGA